MLLEPRSRWSCEPVHRGR